MIFPPPLRVRGRRATVHCAARHRSDINNNNNWVEANTSMIGSDAGARRFGSTKTNWTIVLWAKPSVSLLSETKMAELSRFVAKIIPRSPVAYS